VANAFYTPYLNLLLKGDIDHDTMDLYVDAVDSGYTFSAAHNGRDDITGTAIVATEIIAAAGVTITSNVIDVADFAYEALSGDTIVALVVSVETGESDAQRIPAVFIDTGSGGAINVVPNGEDVNVRPHASGLFAL
jgi:hypothetical protein